jgi:hypothetical protein
VVERRWGIRGGAIESGLSTVIPIGGTDGTGSTVAPDRMAAIPFEELDSLVVDRTDEDVSGRDRSRT